jgi:serine/threonine protein kinase
MSEKLSRPDMIQRVKEISTTFKDLDDKDIATIIKNAYDTSNITNIELVNLISNIKTSIKNLTEPLYVTDMLDVVSSTIKDFDYSKWKQGKKLGEGSYGVVKIAEMGDEKIAFKNIKEYKISSDLIKEIGSYAILTAIGSQNTSKLVGFNLESENFGIATELATMDLFTWVDQTDITTMKNMLPTIVDNLLKSLGEIQSVGIVNCDIKPANMLLTVQGDTVFKTVITDFGMASSFPGNGPFLYTEPFRAPEIWEGCLATFSSDCWAFGHSILSLCLGGEYYYRDSSEFTKKAKLPNTEMTRQLTIFLRDDQVELINKMLSWEPDNRCIKRVTTKVPTRNWNLSENSVITTKMLGILFSWLAILCEMNEYQNHTLSMAIDIVFRFYNNYPVEKYSKNTFQLIGLSALYISSLWGESDPSNITEFERYSVIDINEMIFTILKTINGLLWVPGLPQLQGEWKDLIKLLKETDDYNSLTSNTNSQIAN